VKASSRAEEPSSHAGEEQTDPASRRSGAEQIKTEISVAPVAATTVSGEDRSRSSSTSTTSGSRPSVVDASSTTQLERASEPLVVSRTQPVSEIALQVGSAKRSGVEVQLVDRAGEVHVAVRAADSSLAGSLRNQLGELVTQLERSGYHVETWTPTETLSSPASGLKDLGGAKQDASSGSPGGQSGGGQDHPSQQQQQQRNRPEWSEEFEQNLGSNSGLNLEQNLWHPQSVR